MNKLYYLLLPALLGNCAAADTTVAYLNEINVLQMLAENAVVVNHSEPNSVNAPPLVEKSRRIRDDLLHTRIAAMPDDSNRQGKTALEKTVLRLCDLHLPASRNLQKTIVSSQPAMTEPNIASSQVQQEKEEASSGKLDEPTLKQLIALSKDPNAVAEPLALAQTLYNAGHIKEAAAFYEIAADKTTSMEHTLSPDDKAWILLQLAACYRDTPATAIRVLDKLIAAYPNSAWTSAAVAKRDILQWRQTDKPQSLLEIGHE